ncbi:hypothetical protein EVAR_69882_1 [Eumeta japonica]|uniref:Uncharacterized protein n=1 Tax=Eumeta variegata TaxID=151549 RepID=A0A4C1SJX4_EUMVA|nr:hypothetical protein EVAR_69882_1 [Eumeta japonica]
MTGSNLLHTLYWNIHRPLALELRASSLSALESSRSLAFRTSGSKPTSEHHALTALLPPSQESREQSVGRQQQLKILRSPKSTCSLLKHIVTQGDQPQWYRFDPWVRFEEQFYSIAIDLFKDSDANARPRFSYASISQKQNIKALRQTKTQPAPGVGGAQ